MRRLRLSLWLAGVVAAGGAVAATRTQSGPCQELGKSVTRSGAYCLAHDLNASQGIAIKSSDVTIDLGGHCLVGPGTPENAAVGIQIAAGQNNITLKNGCVAGFMYGLKSEPGSAHVVVEGIAFRHSTFRAALLESDDALVTRSLVDGVGGTRVFTDASTMGLDLRGARSTVSETQVNDVYPVDSGDSVGIAIRGTDGRLLDTTVRNSDRPRWGRTYGIAASPDTAARNNICIHQTYGFSGISAEGNSAIEDDCGPAATSCPDNIEAALADLATHDSDDGRRLFRVGRAYHKAKNYPKAAIYYLAAGRKGIAEGDRIVARHLKFGYITADDKAVADRESAALTGP